MVLLSAWACIKLPQEEPHFLGLRFTATRLALTVVFVVPVGLLIERFLERTKTDAIGGNRMKVFDPLKMTSYPYEEREKNVFYEAPEFKARIIDIPAGGQIPPCETESYVLFYVIRGTAEVKVNGEQIARRGLS